MRSRTLESPPSILPLYLRAAAPLIPGASLLPFVPGRRGEIPEMELTLPGVKIEPQRAAAYAKVCGFTLASHVPPTYPHILAFPLQMVLMADGSFPFAAVGLVHIENQIVSRRPIAPGEQVAITVRPTGLAPHRRGRTFSLITIVRVGEEVVFEQTSTMLHRGRGSEDAPEPAPLASLDPELPGQARWQLPGDLGRRYAAVSGDRNPIHLHRLTARAFGFPRAIAHGMWSKARCLAALQSRLPDAFEAQVRFRRPVLLPGSVRFASAEADGRIEFALHAASGASVHLEGRVNALGREGDDQAADGQAGEGQAARAAGRSPRRRAMDAGAGSGGLER